MGVDGGNLMRHLFIAVIKQEESVMSPALKMEITDMLNLIKSESKTDVEKKLKEQLMKVRGDNWSNI